MRPWILLRWWEVVGCGLREGVCGEVGWEQVVSTPNLRDLRLLSHGSLREYNFSVECLSSHQDVSLPITLFPYR